MAMDQGIFDKVMRRGVSEIIVEEEFEELLKAGKPLRLKMGFDPSRPDIHLGHVVGLRKAEATSGLGAQGGAHCWRLDSADRRPKRRVHNKADVNP